MEGVRAVKRFLLTRSGLVLVGFLGIGGLLLAYEHRVHVFTGNAFLVALLALCVGMHFFMHGSHGGHGGHGGGNDGSDGRNKQ
jgi:hypothetical protein